VEHGNLPGMVAGIDWTTDAFDQMHNQPTTWPYWYSSLVHLFPQFQVRPMTHREWPLASPTTLLESETRSTALPLCISTLVLGLPKTKHGSNHVLMDQYVAYVQQRLTQNHRKEHHPLVLPPPSSSSPPPPSCNALLGGFIRRQNRRRIVNHQDLVATMSQDMTVNVIHFEQMTMREQITSMANYSIVVGMQGAGFINALFLSKHAHVIVLFQYNAASDSFGALLRPRLRKYNRWINSHEQNSFNDVDKDPYHDIADTKVDMKEFTLMWNGEVSGLRAECSGVDEGVEL
jgi:hypothetical protein